MKNNSYMKISITTIWKNQLRYRRSFKIGTNDNQSSDMRIKRNYNQEELDKRKSNYLQAIKYFFLSKAIKEEKEGIPHKVLQRNTVSPEIIENDVTAHNIRRARIKGETRNEMLLRINKIGLIQREIYKPAGDETARVQYPSKIILDNTAQLKYKDVGRKLTDIRKFAEFVYKDLANGILNDCEIKPIAEEIRVNAEKSKDTKLFNAINSANGDLNKLRKIITREMIKVLEDIDILIVKGRLTIHEDGPFVHARTGVSNPNDKAIIIGQRYFDEPEITNSDIAQVILEDSKHILAPNLMPGLIKHSKNELQIALKNKLNRIAVRIGERVEGKPILVCDKDMSGRNLKTLSIPNLLFKWIYWINY